MIDDIPLATVPMTAEGAILVLNANASISENMFLSNASDADTVSSSTVAVGNLTFEDAGAETVSGGSEVEEMSLVNLLWTIGFTFIVVVGTLGNGIVLWIILGKLFFCSGSKIKVVFDKVALLRLKAFEGYYRS